MNDLEFEGFRLDLSRRQLRQGDNVLPLPSKAFDLLVYLARNSWRPLQKSELISHVWPDSFVEDANLNQTVFLVRKVLGPQHERLIVTLPKVGYQFSAQVQELPRRSGVAIEDHVSPGTPTLTFEEFSAETTISRVIYEEETEERVPFYRSPLVLSLSAIALFLLALAARLGWQRWEDHIGGPPVQVVLAATDGTTGDEVLDRTLDSIFRAELAQSPFVTLVPNSTVRAKLTQMQLKPEEKLTQALAREVCERTGSQAVLHRSVARAGNHFLLEEEADNCADGASLGTATREVSRTEQLPEALKSEASELRHRLGESRRTIARFNAPLAPATTSSLEALKDYTEAQRLSSLGRFQEQADLLKQAVALDPQFAAAWADLSTISFNARDLEQSRQYLQKAYDLRSTATEPTQLYITARYHGEVTGDLYESLRNYQTWVEMYPRQAQPWSGMTVVLRQLGRTREQLQAAQHTFALLPANLSVNQSLADAQIRNGDLAAARATCASSIARGIDGDYLRHICLRVGYLQHDAALIAEYEAWGREHPFSPFLLANEALFAQSQGRMADAEKLFAQASDAFHHLGQDPTASSILAGAAVAYASLGEPDAARRILLKSTPNAADDTYLLALAATGDAPKAEQMLNAQLAASPRSTLWNEWTAPLIRGQAFLLEHKPREALAALESTRRFDGKDVDAIDLRGLADFQLRDLTQAELEFRKILNHPETNATAYQRSLAQLQLARTLALKGDKSAAAESYRAFLTMWQRADPGQPLYLAAQSELSTLAR